MTEWGSGMTEKVSSKMKQEKLRVSIVIPVYKVSLYVERCVRSVMAQTYTVLECILVDDASPDDSIAKCEKLIAEYDGAISFVVLHHDHNRGLSAARNTGTEAAQGDYIYYLDSDDEITPDCIEKLAGPVERDPSLEMVQGNHRCFPRNLDVGRITCAEKLTSSESVRACFFDRAVLPVSAWNKLISKKFLTDHALCFKEGLLFEDIPWTFYVMKSLQRLYVIPDITYQYFKHPLSISTGTDKTVAAHHLGIVFEDIARHFTPGEEAREAKFYLRYFFSYTMRNQPLEGYQRILPLFENALAGDDCRKKRFLLRVLRLSTRSAFLRWALAALLEIRLVLLYPIRRLAFR